MAEQARRVDDIKGYDNVLHLYRAAVTLGLTKEVEEALNYPDFASKVGLLRLNVIEGNHSKEDLEASLEQWGATIQALIHAATAPVV